MIQGILDLITDIAGTDYGTKANLYFRLKKIDGTYTVKKVNVTEDTQISIFHKFSGILHNRLRPYEATQDGVLNINDFDYTRNNQIYFFEGAEIEPSMQFLKNEYLTTTELFTTDTVDKIEGVIIRIGSTDNYINLYVPYFSIYGLERDKWFLIRKKMNNQFVSDENEKTIRFNYNISFVYHNNKLLILDFKKLETEFGYSEVLNNKALQKVAIFEQRGLLSENSTLNSLIESNKSIRNKLLKIKPSSPVFSVPVKNLISFIQSKPHLNKFAIVDGKFEINTENNAKLFLKIMDDDYVKSELTGQEYDAEKKNTVES